MPLGTTLFVAVFIVIATITVIGNIVVILAVLLNRRLRNVSNFLMVNLAVSDFFQGALTMPLRVSEVMNTSDKHLVRCDLVISLTILFHSASNFNLALIALDRFIAVSKPFAYANVMKTSVHKIIIALSWLCCLFLSGAIIVGWQRRNIPDNAGDICRYGDILTQEYIILYVCLVDVVPLVIMLVTYSYIFRTTRRQISRIRAHEIAVHHAAINQACECLREDDIDAWVHSQSNEEASAAFPRIEVKYSMNTEEGDTAAKSAAHASPEGAGETCSDNNNIQNDAEESVTPENGRVSLSTIRTNNLDPIEAEMNGTREMYNNNNNHVFKEKVTPRNSNSINLPLSTTRTRKVTRTVMAIMGFFIILCLPITILDMVELWCESCQDRIPPYVFTIALCMVALNSSVNVFVYGGYNTDYRKAYWKIWRRVKDALLNIFTRTKNTAQSAAQTVSSRRH